MGWFTNTANAIGRAIDRATGWGPDPDQGHRDYMYSRGYTAAGVAMRDPDSRFRQEAWDRFHAGEAPKEIGEATLFGDWALERPDPEVAAHMENVMEARHPDTQHDATLRAFDAIAGAVEKVNERFAQEDREVLATEPVPYTLTPEGEHEADYADVQDRNASLAEPDAGHSAPQGELSPEALGAWKVADKLAGTPGASPGDVHEAYNHARDLSGAAYQEAPGEDLAKDQAYEKDNYPAGAKYGDMIADNHANPGTHSQEEMQGAHTAADREFHDSVIPDQVNAHWNDPLPSAEQGLRDDQGTPAMSPEQQTAADDVRNAYRTAWTARELAKDAPEMRRTADAYMNTARETMANYREFYGTSHLPGMTEPGGPLPGEPGYVESPAEKEWQAGTQSPTSKELDWENYKAAEARVKSAEAGYKDGSIYATELHEAREEFDHAYGVVRDDVEGPGPVDSQGRTPEERDTKPLTPEEEAIERGQSYTRAEAIAANGYDMEASEDAEAAEYEFPDKGDDPEASTTPERDAYVEMAEANAVNPGEYSPEAVSSARDKADTETRERMASEREDARDYAQCEAEHQEDVAAAQQAEIQAGRDQDARYMGENPAPWENREDRAVSDRGIHDFGAEEGLEAEETPDPFGREPVEPMPDERDMLPAQLETPATVPAPREPSTAEIDRAIHERALEERGQAEADRIFTDAGVKPGYWTEMSTRSPDELRTMADKAPAPEPLVRVLGEEELRSWGADPKGPENDGPKGNAEAAWYPDQYTVDREEAAVRGTGALADGPDVWGAGPGVHDEPGYVARDQPAYVAEPQAMTPEREGAE